MIRWGVCVLLVCLALTSCATADPAAGRRHRAAADGSKQHSTGSTTATASTVPTSGQDSGDYITLQNKKGMTVVILHLGAIIQRLIVPNRFGHVICIKIEH